VLACGGIVERAIDLENGYLVNHAVHHTVCEVGHVLNAESIETQALIEPVCRVHCPLGTAWVVMTKRIRIIELKLDKHLLAFTVTQFTEVDVNITPVSCDDGRRSASHFADAEAVPIHNFHVKLHIHGPDGHHPTNAAREAAP
jgi:hypothetical protein